MLKMQLTLESFGDDDNVNIPLLRETHLKLGNFRDIRNFLTESEQIKMSDEIIEDYNKVLDIAGRENFIFYDDGDINYIWKDSKK